MAFVLSIASPTMALVLLIGPGAEIELIALADPVVAVGARIEVGEAVDGVLTGNDHADVATRLGGFGEAIRL